MQEVDPNLLITVLVTVITTAGSLGVAWLTVWPKLREQTAKLLRREIEQLRARVDSLERKLDAERTLSFRYLNILKLVLAALNRHEPGTVDAIRRENRDLDI